MRDFEKLTLGKILEQGALSVPHKIAVVDGEQRRTFQELDDLTNGLAGGLYDLGFRKGDRVAIYLKSSIELVIAFYALQKLGVIVAWVNPLYRATEAEFILRDSQAKAVFIFEEWGDYNYLDAMGSIRKDLPNLESIILVGESTGAGVFQFDSLIEQGQLKKSSSPHIDPQQDLAMFIYTSGTTGKPKGVMITHYQAIKAGWEYALGVAATSDDRFIGFLPMTHSYGCGAILIQPILLQATTVLMDKFDPVTAFQIIEKEQITLQLAAPAHYIIELNHKSRETFDLSSLRAGLIAGQPAPKGLITRIEEELGVYVSSFWGASEVGPGVGIICPYPSSLEIRETYIGCPIKDTEVRVVDPATHLEIPDGEIGELALSGWHVLQGYWNNPEETNKQKVDGLLFMGDLVSKAKNGFIKFHGRNKDLINNGGYKIYPLELESLISQHQKVAQVSVVATPNPVLGESVCACIIPMEGETITLEEIRAFLEGQIAHHKIPTELSIMEDFPRLSGGVKLKKFGEGGLAELAVNDATRQFHRKRP